MTKISKKAAYPIKKPIDKDYFVGSDSELFGKTVNFSFEETAYLINKLNGSLIVNYLFKTDNNINLEVLTEGVFLSENNETEVSSITKLYVNKKNFAGDDLSELYTFLKVNKNSFFFKLQNSEDLKNACYFNITDVVDHTDYFIFSIDVFLQNPALQNLVHFNVYFFSFDIKSEAGQGNEDQFTSIGTISLVDNEITISTGFEWEINAGEFANLVPYIETIPFSSTGNQRFVLFVANTFDTFEMISGPESISNPVAPPVPENTIQLTLLLVTDGVIGNPTLPDLSDYATINYVDSHSNRTDNPHNVTKSQIGLSNVDNTSDANKPVSTAQASADAAVLSSANAYTDAGLAGKEDESNKTGTVIGNEASTSLYLHIAGMINYFQQKLTDSIFGTFITSLTAKVTIVDGDTSVVSDSADSGKAKKVTWANIFSYIKSKSETEISYACSDEVSDLAVGTLITFRMPFGMTLTSLKLSLNTAHTGTKLIVDVRKNGATILSTLISADISSTTSVGASVPYVISDSNLTDDSIITILTTQVGSTVAGKGLKVTFLGRRI